MLIFLDRIAGSCYGGALQIGTNTLMKPLIKATFPVCLLMLCTSHAFAGIVPVNTPEPGTILTVGAGTLALVIYVRKRRAGK